MCDRIFGIMGSGCRGSSGRKSETSLEVQWSMVWIPCNSVRTVKTFVVVVVMPKLALLLLLLSIFLKFKLLIIVNSLPNGTLRRNDDGGKQWNKTNVILDILALPEQKLFLTSIAWFNDQGCSCWFSVTRCCNKK